MAVSSLFHHVILREPAEIEAFLKAAEESEKDPYVKPAGYPKHVVTSDPKEILRILELNEKNRAKYSNETRS